MWDAPTIIALLTLIMGGLATAAGLVWRLTRVESALAEKIGDEAKETDARIETVRRDFGETVQAVRQKITEIELYCRDTFMRRDSFYEVNRINQSDMKAFFDRIEKRLERMEEKIDSHA